MSEALMLSVNDSGTRVTAVTNEAALIKTWG